MRVCYWNRRSFAVVRVDGGPADTSGGWRATTAVESRARLREPDSAVYGKELMVTLTVRRSCELLYWRSLFRESFLPRCSSDLILQESVSMPLEYNVGRGTGWREEEPRM